MLFRNLRVYPRQQIWGANTEVGKTVVATALCRAAAAANERVHYLKPVGTGGQESGGDDGHVVKYTKDLNAACLFRFKSPVSPHLAARLDGEAVKVPSDTEFDGAIRSYIQRAANSTKERSAALFVETAGGVNSPTLSGTTQAEAYRPLRLPSILVASPHLGGISTTISAYESLLLRGYTVDAILCMRDTEYENSIYLRDFFRKYDNQLHFAGFPKPPALLEQADKKDEDNMRAYYQSRDMVETFGEVVSHLQNKHIKRLQNLEEAGQKTLDTVWWPFTQQAHFKKPSDVMVIDSALRDSFTTLNSSTNNGNLLPPTFDGSASWWTQCLGHAKYELTLAAAHAMGRYGHVIFPGASHAPALELSQRLVNGVGKGWAAKAFFTDNGSTGMEVAIKMALRAFAQRYNIEGRQRASLKVIGLKGSYHGDTIGAMDATVESVYSNSVEWYRGRGFWFDPPMVRQKDGEFQVCLEGEQWESSNTRLSFSDVQDVYDVPSRLQSQLATVYKQHILKHLEQAIHDNPDSAFGALIQEPVVLGAGGMLFVDPLFQRVLVDTCRSPEYAALANLKTPDSSDGWQNIPVIFDEVFTGLHRLGPLTPASILGCTPDIACYAKILTGGLLPMSVTLASQSIYNTFLSENKVDALLHGHSYTAYPAGCAVANKTLDLIENIDWSAGQKDWHSDKEHGVFSLWSREVVTKLSHSQSVASAMSLGTVLSVELCDDKSTGYTSNRAVEMLQKVKGHLERNTAYGLHARTLGHVLYLMASLDTPRSTLDHLENALLSALAE